jgi:hypothetical protein
VRDEVSQDSTAIGSALIKLNDIYSRMQKLASRKMKSYGPSILSQGNISEGDVEQRVKGFSEALTNYLKLRIRTNSALSALANSLKSLKNATDSKEISTLIGLTALSDRNEYNRNAAMLRRYYKEQLEPAIPEMVKVFKWVANLNDFSEWIGKLINRDFTKREDDFTEMILAIRDNDIGKFRTLYDALEARIKIEESK